MYLRTREEAEVPRAQRAQGREVGDAVEGRQVGVQSCRALGDHREGSVFIFFFFKFYYLFIYFGCIGSSLLHAGSL